MRFRQWVRDHLVTADAIYGLILYSALIAAVSDDDANSMEVMFFSSATLFIFWMAHVYAGTLAGHGPELRLRTSLWRSLDHSSGMLYASILPVAALILGAAGVLSTDDAVDLALTLATIVLGILGFISFAARKSPVIVCILGGVVTAFFGGIIILLNAIVH